MALGARLSRYKKLAWFIAKYSRADFVKFAGLEPVETPAVNDPVAGQAEEFARDLEALGPTFIKLGQLLSTRGDLLPQPFLEALARLQDDIEPFPYADVQRIIEEELGVKLSKLFESFDPVPIAAASLGQVHRAVLHSGREVAVKVQRPGVRERVFADLTALDELAALFDRFFAARNVDAVRLLQEFRKSLMSELDYREEARNLRTLAGQLQQFERIIVPLPIDDYTTPRVLTMDFVSGVKITSVPPIERTEVDGAALADELFRAYLHQILVDGIFHADPHPGNVLLTPEHRSTTAQGAPGKAEGHRLALIDLGMVGRLSATTQEQLFKLLLAIADGRGDEAATIVISLGERREDLDEVALRRAVVDLVARYQGAALRELNVGRVMLAMARAGGQHGLKMAPDMALLGKTLLNLDEIGRVLDPDLDVNASMRNNAIALMRQRVWKRTTSSNLLASALEVRDFAERLPGRVNRILDALACNDLRLKVEVIDQGSILEGLQKVANRIAVGLVLAALIVGAAMMMRVPTEFTILGYPGLAMVLFLAAAGGGFWMALGILLGDVHRRHLG